MSEIKRKSRENHPAYQVSKCGRYLIYQPPILESNFGTKQHAGRYHEHIHYGVFKSLGEKNKDRKPCRDNLTQC